MFGCKIRYRQMSIMWNIVLCHGEKDYMPACPYCPIRWSRERKIICMPAITARLGVHGRERLHACLPLLPDTAILGGHGREKLHACH